MFVGKDGIEFADSQELYNSVDGLHQSLLAAGWTVYDTVSAVSGSEDVVYSSNGENGLETIFMRIIHSATSKTIKANLYGMWRKDGAYSQQGFNMVGVVNGISLPSSPFHAWLSVDKNGLTLVAGPQYKKLTAGILQRIDPPTRNGFTRLAAPLNGANLKTSSRLYLVAGTDFTKFQIGQNIWIVSVPQDDSFQQVPAEKVTIAGIDSGARFIYISSQLANDYPYGSIVSLNPQPFFIKGELDKSWQDSPYYGMFGGASYGNNPTLTQLGMRELPSLDSNGHAISEQPVLMVMDEIAGIVQNFALSKVGFLDEDEAIFGTERYRLFMENSLVVVVRVE